MNKNINYYRTTNIDKTGAPFRILLGQRANGKSYAVKEKVLKNAFLTGEQFVYMRRYQFDVRANDVESYFSDMPVNLITNGEYNIISCYRGNIYFANYDIESNKIIKGKQIGRAVYLSGLEHFKSQAFPDVTNIIYEEFVTNRMYLNDEPTQLMQFVSTIARHNSCVVWLIGNTISRMCPYFTDFELRNVPKMEQGTIDIYHKHTGDIDELGNEIIVDIAVEFCGTTKYKNTMFFGKVAENITSGSWETKNRPHLPGTVEDYTMCYELLLRSNGFEFVLQLLCNAQGGFFVYVYPFTHKRNIKRVITNEFSINPLHTSNFNANIKAEQKLKELLTMNKICYSDNLTGGDFEQVLATLRGEL